MITVCICEPGSFEVVNVDVVVSYFAVGSVEFSVVVFPELFSVDVVIGGDEDELVVVVAVVLEPSSVVVAFGVSGSVNKRVLKANSVLFLYQAMVRLRVHSDSLLPTKSAGH